MRTNETHATGPTPAPREHAPVPSARRRSELRLVRSERRRLERPRDGRFEYLKRTYD